MGRNTAQRRQKLFETYAANFGHYVPKEAGKLACPICASSHGPESTHPDTLTVDLAHVYPRSCGGKLETLTCCKCNSTIGSEYDSQLTIEHRGHENIKTGLAARIYFNGGNVGARIRKVSDTHWHHDIVPEQSDPAALAAFKAQLNTVGAHATFRTQFKWIHTDRHNAAVLHSAYLTLFREYGYEYLFFCDTEWIRDILEAETPPSDPFIMTMPLAPGSEIDPRAVFGTGVAEFEGKRFLTVALPSPQPDQRFRMVLLPGVGPKSAEDYRELLRQPERTEAIAARFNMQLARDPTKRLADPKGVGYLHWLWKRPV